mgnify:FL=1
MHLPLTTLCNECCSVTHLHVIAALQTLTQKSMVAAGDDEDDDNVAASQDYDYNNYNDVTNFCPSVSDKFIYYDCWVTKIVFLLHFEFQETECIIALGPM